MVQSCGNGVVEGGEQCDDHNTLGWDLCTPDCELPVCGNGEIDRCEGAATPDACTNFEQCDDGPANSDTTPDACRTDCERAHCGDGVIDAGEECDDGGLANGDGCNDVCEVE